VKPELVLFVGAVIFLAATAIYYSITALPEVTKYNQELTLIHEEVARCNCSAVCRGGLTQFPPSADLRAVIE
jgi:hypothetical protein